MPHSHTHLSNFFSAFTESSLLKNLAMEAVDDKSSVQSTKRMLRIFNDLINLPDSQGDQRAATFHALVSELRALTFETMQPALKEMVEKHVLLTLQAVGQCGTPECTSAMLQTMRHFNVDALEIDTTTYVLAMLSNPSRRMVQDVLEMAKYKPSKPIMYALSHVVNK